jgi:hypothetical protein
MCRILLITVDVLLIVGVCASMPTRARRDSFYWNPFALGVPTKNGPFVFNPNIGVGWQAGR